MSSKNQDGYNPIVSTSPYARADRYQYFKEDHKNIINFMKSYINTDKSLSLLDAGCGNGEFLYHLHDAFPGWDMRGIDLTPEFIDVARNFLGLDGVAFESKSLFDESGQYDVVICTGVVQIFKDVEPILDKLLELVRPGGWVFADGFFNPYPVEVRIEYCDNSNDASRGIWRVDFNTHSQMSIKEIFSTKVQLIEFHELVMGVDLPRNHNDAANRAWTFRDANGKIIVTSGLNIIMNKTLLVIQK